MQYGETQMQQTKLTIVGSIVCSKYISISMFLVEIFALCVSFSHCPLDLQQRSEKELKKVVTPEDAPTALRLVIHDAATFDVATGQGGLNGSIITRCTFPHPHIAVVNTNKLMSTQTS